MLKKCIRVRLQKKNKTFCSSLHYDRENSHLFVNGTEITKFKSKIPEIILPRQLCLGNISKDWSVDNMKKARLNGMFMILVLIMMLLQLMTL